MNLIYISLAWWLRVIWADVRNLPSFDISLMFDFGSAGKTRYVSKKLPAEPLSSFNALYWFRDGQSVVITWISAPFTYFSSLFTYLSSFCHFQPPFTTTLSVYHLPHLLLLTVFPQVLLFSYLLQLNQLFRHHVSIMLFFFIVSSLRVTYHLPAVQEPLVSVDKPFRDILFHWSSYNYYHFPPLPSFQLLPKWES